MKTSLQSLLIVAALAASPAFAEQYYLHVQLMGNPDSRAAGLPSNGLSMHSEVDVTDGNGAVLPGMQWKCLTGAGYCKNGGEAKDTISGSRIKSNVYSGIDEIVAPINTAQTIVIDATLTTYTGAVKKVRLQGVASPGEFSQYYMINAPGKTGEQANVGINAWLSRQQY